MTTNAPNKYRLNPLKMPTDASPAPPPPKYNFVAVHVVQEPPKKDRKNKPIYEKLGVDPYDRKATRKAQQKIWKSNKPRLQFAGHVWHHVTREEFNLLRPIPWKERPLPERYRK